MKPLKLHGREQAPYTRITHTATVKSLAEDGGWGGAGVGQEGEGEGEGEGGGLGTRLRITGKW